MAIVKECARHSQIFWQAWDEENECQGQPALLIEEYIGEIQITQEGGHVIISCHELPALIKLLQKIVKHPNT